MRRMIVLLLAGILFSVIGYAEPLADLYCKVIFEAEDFDINIQKLYLTKDEAGKPKAHLEADVMDETNISDFMKVIDAYQVFGTVRLDSTRLKEEGDGVQFQISFPITINEKINLEDKDRTKDPNTGEIRWHWKGLCDGAEAVDVNARGSDGNPYLIKRIRGFADAEEIAAVLEAGADPNVNDKTWSTPLINASMICSPQVVQVLLKGGAQVNDKDSTQDTALTYSSLGRFPSSACVETAELLLQAGASVECEVLLYAAQAPVANTKVPQLIERLIAAGADMNCKSENTGATPLINASSSENASLVKTLLAEGADPNLTMIDGASALKIATENNNQEIIKLLKAAGAK